ncbi:E1-E2 ATPase-domain-containing protein, partial [Cunninghamella echinulata]
MNVDLIKKKHWHTLSIDEITTSLQTSSVTGLTTEQVNQRREIFGLNEISSDDGPKWLKIALRQLVDVMNWIFIIFGVACYVLSDYPTGTMLLVIAILNFYLSFSQEYAAEQTLAALRNLSSPMAKVIRDGHPIDIKSNDLVPGDLLMINHGDSVAADLRLTKISNLEADESLLTGESVPVNKDLAVLENLDEPLGDRLNMAYSSTVIAGGHGQGIVTATGMHTEIGQIATKLNQANKEGDTTQIQKSLNKMYIALMIAAVLCVIIVLASVKFQANYDVGMYCMTAAMSVLPAGLTTVMTVTLVMGGKEMANQKAVVRKLKCLETLGSVTNIFSDKTGTLT